MEIARFFNLKLVWVSAINHYEIYRNNNLLYRFEKDGEQKWEELTGQKIKFNQ